MAEVDVDVVEGPLAATVLSLAGPSVNDGGISNVEKRRVGTTDAADAADDTPVESEIAAAPASAAEVECAAPASAANFERMGTTAVESAGVGEWGPAKRTPRSCRGDANMATGGAALNTSAKTPAVGEPLGEPRGLRGVNGAQSSMDRSDSSSFSSAASAPSSFIA